MMSRPSSVKFKIPLADPLIGDEEAEAVYDVVRSGWVREGKIVDEFEREFAKYLGMKYAIATSSGTTALHVTLASLGVQRGDEVVLPSFTCSPPVSMTLLLQGVPVFADIETQTYNIDADGVRKMLSRKTKAIMPINYAGHPAELDVLQEVASEFGVYLVNDAAQALGGTYKGKNIANFGDVVVFSFSPNKTITTGEGGMIVTNDEGIAEKARIIKDYGQKERFHYIELGSNYHLTEMQAAMGLVQMRKIDAIIKRKRSNAELLTEKLSTVKHVATPVELPGCVHAYCLYSIRVLSSKVDRNSLMEKLENAGIQTRVYFPPMHKSPLVKKFKFRMDKLQNTENVSSTVLSLPSSPKLGEREVEYVYEVMRNAFSEKKEL